MVLDYHENPKNHFVLAIWLTCIVMFIVGIAVPPIGRIELADSGLHIVEVGFVSTFGIWFLGLFVDLQKLDKKK